jgi:hypothetical protein
VGLGLAPTLIALITDHVLHDHNKVNLAMLLVAVPALLLAALLASIAMPNARRLREKLIADAGGNV